MTIELVKINQDGSGRFLCHLDDGSSFGQGFTDAPMDDDNVLLKHLTRIADQVVERNTAVLPKSVPPTITAMIGQQRDVIRA